jgi:hypothetical protein
MPAQSDTPNEKLRDELMAWQAGQREMQRWKLIAMGGVGALGLGPLSTGGRPVTLVLCLIPFIAAYCDALFLDYDVRIALIGFFQNDHGGTFAQYESYVGSSPVERSRWWQLGGSASFWSSLVACGLTALVGVYGLAVCGTTRQMWFESVAAMGAAATGAALAVGLRLAYYATRKRIREAK